MDRKRVQITCKNCKVTLQYDERLEKTDGSGISFIVCPECKKPIRTDADKVKL